MVSTHNARKENYPVEELYSGEGKRQLDWVTELTSTRGRWLLWPQGVIPRRHSHTGSAPA